MRVRLIILSMLVSTSVLAQEYEYAEEDIYRSKVRAILNMFSISVATGYNSTIYKHDLSGYYYLQSPTEQLIIRKGEGVLPLPEEIIGYDNWFNNPTILTTSEEEIITDVPYPAIDRPVYSDQLNTGFTIYDADSIGLGYKAKGWDVPLNLSLRFNYMNFRAGVGFSIAPHKINSFRPTVDGHGIRRYHPMQKVTMFKKYYFLLGYKFYDWWDYSFAGELELGKHNLGNKFPGASPNGWYFGVGISIEKNLSEYFRIFLKPSYDFRSMTTVLPEDGGSIRNRYHAFNLGLGVSITIPEIPLTPIKSDKVQLKHVIVHPKTGKYAEVRGQRVWKKQNPKVGQNHRKHIRNKWGNRRKLNPY